MSADDGRSPSRRSEDDPSTVGRVENDADDGEVAASDSLSSVRGLGRDLLSAREGPLMVVREVLVSVGTVALVGLLLFGLSGVWPPMVAVESGSMEPHMHRGDLVFVSEPGRYVPDGAAADRGVVTRREGERVDYRTFGGYGSVVVYDRLDRAGPPVIHRAHFWVAAGENWYDEADRSYHSADSCRALPNCPAPHAGFITKGDANAQYDQVNGITPSGPVRPSEITGIAQVRVPYLGHVRLWIAERLGATVAVRTPGEPVAATAGPSVRPMGGTPARTLHGIPFDA